MKVFSRDFTTREKVVLVLLAAILLFALYYWGVDQPTRRAIARADSEYETAQIEMDVVSIRVAEMEKMSSEVDTLDLDSGIMGSYNNSKAELDILNGILESMPQYSVKLSGLTRSGDQVRRTFELQFTAKDYSAARGALAALEDSEYRCLIDGVRCTIADSGEVSMTASVTFYETLVGGVPDEALPEDRSAA